MSGTLSGLLKPSEMEVIRRHKYSTSKGMVTIEFVNGEFYKIAVPTSPVWTLEDLQLMAECKDEIDRLIVEFRKVAK